VARLQLVLRHGRTGVDPDDGRLDIEAREGPFDQLDIRLDLVVQPLLADGNGIEQVQVGLHPDPLDLIFHEARHRRIAIWYDRQHGLSVPGLLSARGGLRLVFDRPLQCRNRRFELERRGHGRRPGGRRNAIDRHQHRLSGFGAHHLIAWSPGLGRPLLFDRRFALGPVGEVVLAQRSQRFAKGDIESEDQPTQEDGAEDQDAARGPSEASQRLSLDLAHRSTGAARRQVKETE
jgi:hypothetical protein